MRGKEPSRATIVVVSCTVASILIISFLLLILFLPGIDNHKNAPDVVVATDSIPTSIPIDTPVPIVTGASTATATSSTPTTTPISKGTSVPIVTGTSTTTATPVPIPTATPTYTPTPTPTAEPDPDPTSFTISVQGGGQIDFTGTVGQQDTEPNPFNLNIYYPDPNLPRKSPPPGPITWSISATPQDNPIGNWLTFSLNSGTMQYGSQETIKVNASVLPRMQANITYTMKLQATPNANVNYAMATLTLSDPTPTPIPNPDPDPTSFTISVQGATYCYTGTVGQSDVQPAPDNPPLPDIIYDGSTKPPPIGPINWSVAALPPALPQEAPSCSDPSPCTDLSGNWLSFDPSSGSIPYGSRKTITLQASVAASMQAGVYCTKFQFYPVNSDKDYAYAELIVSPAPTPVVLQKVSGTYGAGCSPFLLGLGRPRDAQRDCAPYQRRKVSVADTSER